MLNGYWFEWNGVKSSELGSTYGLNDVDYQLVVRKAINIPSPARKTQVYKIPGRSGDYVLSSDAWENVKIDIELFLYCSSVGQANLHKFCRAISEWLHSGDGEYNDLVLSGTEGYREAYFVGPYNVENMLYKYGRATISFNASPKHYVEYDAYRYRQSSDPSYDGEHEMRVVYQSIGGTIVGHAEVDINNDTTHNSRPRICIRQPDLSSSFGSAQIYPFLLTVECGDYRLEYDFTGRPFPDGNTGFINVVIDSDASVVRVTNAVMDSQVTPKHVKTKGVNSIRWVDFVAKENAPNNSDFPWFIAGEITTVSVWYYKDVNGTKTYFRDVPQLIAIEPRRWTL